MPSLSIASLFKTYPNGRKALRDITLTIGEGVFGLLGPNGAGKSTLMEILTGGLAFEQGRVALGDIDLVRNAPQWRESLGYLPQHFDFPPELTGREILHQGALLLGLSPRALRERIGVLLERVNLTWAADREAASYSRGMKQRLGVALALLGDPPLVILDEPTAGLDPEERVFFRDLLTECAAGRVVILSTHIVGDIERCCSRVGIIVRGKLLFDGTPGELTQRVVGQVWEFPIEPEDMEAWVASRRVVGMVERGGDLLARVVTPEKPAPQAVAVEATFEDAYMGTIGPAGAALTEA